MITITARIQAASTAAINHIVRFTMPPQRTAPKLVPVRTKIANEKGARSLRHERLIGFSHGISRVRDDQFSGYPASLKAAENKDENAKGRLSSIGPIAEVGQEALLIYVGAAGEEI